MATALRVGQPTYRSSAYEVRPGAATGRWLVVAGDDAGEERMAREVAVAVSQRSGREVRITGHHVLSLSDASVPLLILLRELQSVGANVRWHGDVSDVDINDLVHLPPPERSPTASSPAVQWWRLRHQYGLFYYRQGPGFVSVVDRREPSEAQRYVVHDPAMLDVFRAGLGGEPAAQHESPAASAALLALRDERAVLAFGRLLLTLPCRIRRWPVRYDAV
jgi:Family of unknown function (DUF5825)